MTDRWLAAMRRFCGTLTGALSEKPHRGDTMFYVHRRPFALCGAKGIAVGLEPEHAQLLLARDPRFQPYPRAAHAVRFDPAKVPAKEWQALVRESHAIVLQKIAAKTKRR